ncbi:MAG: hypothetical protein RLZZ450_5539 [Pseudomonadota bacterium]|jgi:hypothetical protein
MRAARVLALLVVGSLACTPSAQRARGEIDRARIEHARTLDVARRAPLAYEQFEAAQRAALQHAPESAARADSLAEARLWLETGIVEAERAQLSERRLQEERSLIESDTKLSALLQERESWAREADLQAARAIARSEAQRALVRAAEQRSVLRVKLPREDAKQAAEALWLRAELIALTLESIGKSGAGLLPLRAKLAEVDALLVRDPDGALLRADQALFMALGLAGELRGQGTEPSAEEQATLGEELAAAGVHAVRNDVGLSGVLEHAFADYALAPVAERVIERLCVLANAHTRGPVRIGVHAKSDAQAEARSRWVKLRFAKAGCEGQRFTVVFSRLDGDTLDTTWLSY